MHGQKIKGYCHTKEVCSLCLNLNAKLPKKIMTIHTQKIDKKHYYCEKKLYVLKFKLVTFNTKEKNFNSKKEVECNGKMMQQKNRKEIFLKKF